MSPELIVEGSVENITILKGIECVEVPYSEVKKSEFIEGRLVYPIEFLPEYGRYWTSYKISIKILEEGGKTKRITKNSTSACVFSGKYVDKSLRSDEIRLYKDDSRTKVGFIENTSDSFPETLNDGDEIYVDINIDYPHKEMLQQYTESEIENKREKFKKDVKEISGMSDWK